MAKQNVELPIDGMLPAIVAAVQASPILLLEAEAGAGKTTRVPASLLKAGLAEIYVLEPRRLAARLAARRVAEELGERVGDTVGYQVRFDEVSSERTRLWYLTEGVLTRRLFADPRLQRARVVVLDEFHERHLETDLALALLRKVQEKRQDLHLILMSATLGSDRLAAKLGNAPIIKAPGRIFPVALEYRPHSAEPLEQQAMAAVQAVLPKRKGHVLVFLPGAAEIRKTIAACQALAGSANAVVLPLHGDLSPEEQDAAVAPSATRKIICSTNVAESSITIDGVDAVIDSGVARVPSHSAWSGLSRLRVEKISRASAIQRAGRAGRTGPGVAIRLYPESDFVRRQEEATPEILRADLAQVLLQIAAFGMEWDELNWLDAPAQELRDRGRDLLVRLHAFTSSGELTDSGRDISRLPVHPRLGRFVSVAASVGALNEGARLAAVLSEGRFRLEELRCPGAPSDIDALLAVESSYTGRRLQSQLTKLLSQRGRSSDPHGLEKALLCGYPDRVARRRGESLLLSNGTSARLDRNSSVSSEFLIAIEIDDRSEGMPLVRVAASIEADWLLDFFPDRIDAHEELAWNREAERVEQVNSLRFDALTIDETRSAPADPDAASSLLAAKALEAGVERFTDSEELGQFLRRVQFSAEHGCTQAPSDLLSLGMRLLSTGLSSFAELREAGRTGRFIAILQSLLPMRSIEEIAPTHVLLPSGRRARIDYHEGRPPSVSSRLQDFFGMRETPTVARGSVPLVVQLLAPNHRPVQVTTDLVSFWKNLYPQVRRELSRRYPRHSWPENPG